jgi:hypothetical protein
MALLDKLGRIKPIWDASKDTTPYLAYGPFVVEDPRRSYIAMYLSAVKEPNRQISLQWFDNTQIIAKLVVGNPEIVDDKISFRAFATDSATDRYLIRPLLQKDKKLFKLPPDVDVYQYALQTFQPR